MCPSTEVIYMRSRVTTGSHPFSVANCRGACANFILSVSIKLKNVLLGMDGLCILEISYLQFENRKYRRGGDIFHAYIL